MKRLLVLMVFALAFSLLLGGEAFGVRAPLTAKRNGVGPVAPIYAEWPAGLAAPTRQASRFAAMPSAI